MLMVENGSGQPVALAGSFGPGRFVYLAASLDSYTNEGTSHYPYFLEYLSTTFGATSPRRRSRLEVYFDPNYRLGADLNPAGGQMARFRDQHDLCGGMGIQPDFFLCLRRLRSRLLPQRNRCIRLVRVPHGDSEDVG